VVSLLKRPKKNIDQNLSYLDKTQNISEENNLKEDSSEKSDFEENIMYIGKVSAFDDFVYFNLRYSKFLELTDKLSNGTFLLIKRDNKLLLSQIVSQKDLSIYEEENKIKAIITHNEDITSTERDIYTSREYKLKILGTLHNNQFKKEIEFYPTRLDEILFFNDFNLLINYFNQKNYDEDYLEVDLGKLRNGNIITDYNLKVYLKGFVILLNLGNEFITKFLNSLSKNVIIFTPNRNLAFNIIKNTKFKLIDLNSLNLNNLSKDEKLNLTSINNFNLVFLYENILGFDCINIIKLLLEQFIRLNTDSVLFLDDDINYFDDKFLAKNIFFKQFIYRLNNKLFIYKTSSLDKFSVSVLSNANYIISKDISLNDSNKIYSNFNLVNFYRGIGFEITNGELILAFYY
jgi:hypothetical protein